MEIIRMKPNHIPAVAQLEKACFSSPWSETTLTESLSNPNAVFFIAEEEKSVVGYAGLYHILDEGYIANIAVFPACRRKGAAQALLNELTAYAEETGLSFLTLEVRPSNTAALSLYKKNGFEQKGLRRGFYTLPKEDALIMTKVINH